MKGTICRITLLPSPPFSHRFNIVNETLSDKSIISHYFHQGKQLKGKEFKTEIYDSNSNIYSRTENNFNFTQRNASSFIINLLSTSSYTFDGNFK
ncbi:hypothetical protein HY637_00855 [Candidatus Woesearchaeota archaeon]|nr:hypothetical protein [Candidatus Woesearchaeota archaeon]